MMDWMMDRMMGPMKDLSMVEELVDGTVDGMMCAMHPRLGVRVSFLAEGQHHHEGSSLSKLWCAYLFQFQAEIALCTGC